MDLQRPLADLRARRDGRVLERLRAGRTALLRLARYDSARLPGESPGQVP